MKIAIIDELHEIKRSGVYYSTEALKDMFNSSGVPCDIIAIKKRGHLFNRTICTPFFRECILFPLWNLAIVKRLQRQSYDVVFYQCSTSLLLIRKSTYKKAIYTRSILTRQLSIYRTLPIKLWQRLVTHLLYPLVWLIERYSFRHADRIVASKTRLAAYIEKTFDINPVRFKVVPQMVNIKKSKLTTKTKDYDLLFIGRLSAPKNWDMILEIARKMPYRIAAATPEYEMPADLPDNIRVFQRIPYDELGDLINSCRVFIMPSHKEEGPRVTLEAMSFGMPVVASPEGAGDFIEQNVNGIVVSSDLVDDYIAAIEVLLHKKARDLNMIRKNNIEKAQKYQPEVLGPKYIEALTF